MPPVRLEPVDSVQITTLVDDASDMLLPDQRPAKQPLAFIQNSVGTRFEL